MATEQESLTGFAIWNLTNVESIPNLRVTKKKNGLVVLVYGIGVLRQPRSVPEKQKLSCLRVVRGGGGASRAFF